MEPEDVVHVPEPLSPRNRNRVHKVEPTYRSHRVQYLPEPHTALANHTRTKSGSEILELIAR